ncbi:MAG: porin [bacterium JZ-2024 1]
MKQLIFGAARSFLLAALVTFLVALKARAADEKVEVKFSGQVAAGILDGQSANAGGVAPENASFNIPRFKLRWDVKVPGGIGITVRADGKESTLGELDYLWVDWNSKLGENPFRLRVGRHKPPVGEETFTDNVVESPVIFNSAGIIAGVDEGLELWTRLGSQDRPVELSLTALNGNRASSSQKKGAPDNNSAKSFVASVKAQITDNLEGRISFFDSGDMGTADSEISIAGLRSPPSGSSEWSRQITALYLRYDIHKGKKFNPPSFSDSKTIIRVHFADFQDDVVPSNLSLQGTTWFADLLHHINPRTFLSGRYSVISLDNNATAKLNGVTANEYSRAEVSLGYRINERTLFRAGYQINETSPNDPDDNVTTLLFVGTW